LGNCQGGRGTIRNRNIRLSSTNFFAFVGAPVKVKRRLLLVVFDEPEPGACSNASAQLWSMLTTLKHKTWLGRQQSRSAKCVYTGLRRANLPDYCKHVFLRSQLFQKMKMLWTACHKLCPPSAVSQALPSFVRPPSPVLGCHAYWAVDARYTLQRAESGEDRLDGVAARNHNILALARKSRKLNSPVQLKS
jgi:hypothetical protein